MTEYLFGQRKTERHKEYGPVDGVEPYYILAHYMHIGRPQFFELLRRVVDVVADARYIVGQRVQPYIHNVPCIEVDRNAPLERGTRNAQVLQLGFKSAVLCGSGKLLVRLADKFVGEQEVIEHFVLS